MDLDCKTCEWYTRARRAGALLPVPYCSALGFYIPSTTLAASCRQYTPRPGINRIGGP